MTWTNTLTQILTSCVTVNCKKDGTEPEDMDSTQWDQVAEGVHGKTGAECREHWMQLHFQKGNKIKWTPLEDKILKELIIQEGPEKWASLARQLYQKVCKEAGAGEIETVEYVHRNGKQCRERWLNALDPNINKGSWSTQDDIDFLKHWLKIGNKWKEIADKIPGRTESQVKNRFKLILRHEQLEKVRNDYNALK